jgi:pilus assembly protein FimV
VTADASQEEELEDVGGDTVELAPDEPGPPDLATQVDGLDLDLGEGGVTGAADAAQEAGLDFDLGFDEEVTGGDLDFSFDQLEGADKASKAQKTEVGLDLDLSEAEEGAATAATDQPSAHQSPGAALDFDLGLEASEAPEQSTAAALSADEGVDEQLETLKLRPEDMMSVMPSAEGTDLTLEDPGVSEESSGEVDEMAQLSVELGDSSLDEGLGELNLEAPGPVDAGEQLLEFELETDADQPVLAEQGGAQIDQVLDEVEEDVEKTQIMLRELAGEETAAQPGSEQTTLVLDEGLSGEIDEIQTKLDLAQAYIDMGDNDGARGILGEVVSEGNDTQKQAAEGLLARLG